MFLQLLTSRSDQNPLENDGTVTDPKNANAVALLLIPLIPAALPVLEVTDPVLLLKLAAPLVTAGVAVTLLILGLAAETKWHASDRVARPKVPAKILGALALGVTVSLLVLVHTDGGPVSAVTKGIIGTVLALLSFGLDPLKDKGLATAADREQLVVSTAAAKVADRLAVMQASVDGLGNYAAKAAISDVGAAITRLNAAVLLDPVRHRIARRHLGPMMDGVEQATQKFVKLWTITPDSYALLDFSALAAQVAAEFHRAAVAYAREGAEDLKVEAAVLRSLMTR